MTFELPLPPNMGNRRGHWTGAWRAQREFFRACDERVNAGFIPRRPARPLEKVELGATFYVHNLMDYDNLVARLKHAQDWLVRRGYVLDDSPKYLTIGEIAQQIDRKNKRLELVLSAP